LFDSRFLDESTYATSGGTLGDGVHSRDLSPLGVQKEGKSKGQWAASRTSIREGEVPKSLRCNAGRGLSISEKSKI